MPYSVRLVSLLFLSFALSHVSFAQSCYIQQDCGHGMLCSESQTCQPIRSVLNNGSNTVYWVDQALGNDGNNGSEGQPFKTISRAMQSGTMSAGDAVVIRKGTYYEPIMPSVGGQPGKMVTITGFPGEEVVVSGAQSIPGTWQADGNAWRITWPFEKLWHRVVANDPYGPARRRDVVIANGSMLQAVYSRADLREGTFFLEGSPYNPTTLYVQLQGGQNPNNANMATSLINHLFNTSNNEPDCRFGQTKGYFHLIGITFRHAANDGQAGAVCSGTEGSLIENVTVEWTNGSGFLVFGKNHKLRGVRALHNGMSGIRGDGCEGCLVELSASKYNNWKGYTVLWESGGGKWWKSKNNTFRKVDFSENNGPGLWFDTDNYDNVVEQSRFDSNLGVNLFIEREGVRTIVRNNVFTRGRYFRPNYYGHGVLIHASQDNLILYNTFMANEGGGLRILTDSRAPATGNRYFNNLFVANTRFVWGDHRSSEISFEEHNSIGEARSNKGEGNVFWYRNYAEQHYHTFQFRLDQPGSEGVLKSSTLKQWQQIAQTDWQSGTTDPSRPHVADTTDHIAGWRLPENSQYLGNAIPLPSYIDPVLTDIDGNPRPASGGTVGADQPSGFNGGGGSGSDSGGNDSGDGNDSNGSGDGANGNDGSGGSGNDGGEQSTSNESESENSQILALEQSYPNPARGLTHISYNLPTPMGVSLKLYDALGREVKTLVEIGQPTGRHSITLDVSDLPAGIYYYRFQVSGTTLTRTLSVVR